MTTDRIKAIQKQIVAKLEAGEDVSELSRQLAQERAKIAAEAEVQELKKIANERQVLRDKMEAVVARAAEQDTAIDEFLAERDKVVEQLMPLLEPMRRLAQLGNASWESEPGRCYLYNDAGQFSADVKSIPKELLPDGFKCSILEMSQPGERSFGKGTQALQYFQWCLGVLTSLRKGYMAAHSQPADDSLLLGNETEATEANCLCCQHEKASEINKALQDGRPLRELETEWNVSRSTLSRHKRKCLGIEVVRFTDNA